MNIEEIINLIKEVEEPNYIDCSISSGYIDNEQYKRIMAALNKCYSLYNENEKIKTENMELLLKAEVLEKRLKHLLISNSIAAYDEVNPVSKDYLLDINEVDSFFKTGNKLIFEYAEKNKTDRVDDFKIETKKEKHMTNKKIVYDPIPKKPIELKIKITENSDKKVECPLCGNPVGKYPAISRMDNKTKICSNCGTLEALKIFQESLKDEKVNE